MQGRGPAAVARPRPAPECVSAYAAIRPAVPASGLAVKFNLPRYGQEGPSGDYGIAHICNPAARDKHCL